MEEWPIYIEPRFFPVTMPHDSTPSEVEGALKELPIAANQSVSDPFGITPEMRRWARQAAQGATNDLERARRLFDRLPPHQNAADFDYYGNSNPRTAVETFKVMTDQKSAIVCQDYTFLYVALARSLGLKAYYVLVARDCGGVYVDHACAGVFIQGKALLVDPAYCWFGVPHEKFNFLNDLQASLLFARAKWSSANDMRILRKFVPEWAEPHFFLTLDLIEKGRLVEARRELEAGLAISPESWMAFYAQAGMDGCDSNWDKSITHLHRALALMPDGESLQYVRARVHLMLARSLVEQGKLPEARHECQFLLQNGKIPEIATNAQAVLDYLDDLPAWASFTNAYKLYTDGKLKEARTVFNTTLQGAKSASLRTNVEAWIQYLDQSNGH